MFGAGNFVNGTLPPMSSKSEKYLARAPPSVRFRGCHLVETCPKIGKLWGACQMQALGKKRMDGWPHTTTFRLWLAFLPIHVLPCRFCLQLHLPSTMDSVIVSKAPLGFGSNCNSRYYNLGFSCCQISLDKITTELERFDLGHITHRRHLRPPAKLELDRATEYFPFFTKYLG